MFYVGQKVVKFKVGIPNSVQAISISVGTVLTIRAIQTSIRKNGEVMTGLLFEEVRNEPKLTAVGVWENDYDPSNYRPVVEKKTDISIFKAMLNKTPQQNKKELSNV